MKQKILIFANIMIACGIIFLLLKTQNEIDLTDFNNEVIQINNENYDVYYRDYEEECMTSIYILKAGHILFDKTYTDSSYETTTMYVDVNGDGNKEIFFLLNDIYSNFGAKNLLTLNFNEKKFEEIPNIFYDDLGNEVYDFSDLYNSNAPSMIEVETVNNNECLKFSFLDENQDGYDTYYMRLNNNKWQVITMQKSFISVKLFDIV